LGADLERSAQYAKSVGERENKHQAALIQYQLSLSHLNETQKTLIDPNGPAISVMLAKGHLDVARELALLHRDDEARAQVSDAQDLLNDMAKRRNLARRWAWRVHYLLGDVCLFKRDRKNAVFYYQLASAENSDFVPAAALVDYLNDDGSDPTSDQPAPDLHPTHSVEAVPVVSPVSKVKTSPSIPAPTPSSKRPEETPKSMSAEIQHEVPASAVTQLIGAGLTFIAEVLEITELAPVAAFISLVGMIQEVQGK